MPNLKSAIKRMRSDETKRARNTVVKSTMRTFVKKTIKSIEAGDKESATLNLQKAFTHLDRAAKKGLVHKNYASRHKAKLAQKVASL